MSKIKNIKSFVYEVFENPVLDHAIATPRRVKDYYTDVKPYGKGNAIWASTLRASTGTLAGLVSIPFTPLFGIAKLVAGAFLTPESLFSSRTKQGIDKIS